MLPRAIKNLSLRRMKWRQPVGKLVGWNKRYEDKTISVGRNKRYEDKTISDGRNKRYEDKTISVGDDLLLRRLEATLTRHVRNQNLIDRMKV